MRVPQPPILPRQRDPEHHAFWPAFGVALGALILLFLGAWHPTGLLTEDDEPAGETELIKAFARGGLEFQSARVRFDPTAFDDPDRAAAAMDQAVTIAETPLRERYRVNTAAADPCPT